MSATIAVKLDTRALDKLAASLNMETDRVIASAASQVEAEAKYRAPVDTSALKNSIHTERKKAGLYWVADGVDYGVYIEFGHLTKPFTKSFGAQRFVAARPWLIPAVEKVRKQLDTMFAEIVK